MKENNQQEPIEPRLVEILDQLRPVHKRDPIVAEQNQQKFLAELESINLPSVPKPLFERLVIGMGLKQGYYSIMEKMNMLTKKSRIALTIATAFIVVFTVLFGGSAMTVLAAQSAIPGDALYPVKTTLEQTRFSLARNAALRAELQLEFADLRLDEIELLIAQGRTQNLQAATQAFEAHIQNALAEIEVISGVNPALAADLMEEITGLFSDFSDTLGLLLNDIPEPLRSEVERNIRIIRGESEDDNGNEGAVDNQNGNLNDNTNDDLDDNTNDDLDDNTNADLDDNTNDDLDEVNDNTNDDMDDVNDNTNTNQNANTNDNSNENDNRNDNDD